MLVYILDKDNKPLMPCCPRIAKLLLRDGKAIVTQRTPFTIKLLFGSSGYKQEIILGVDAGSKTIGLSATTDKKELFSAEVQLRTDIVDLLSSRRQNRRTRRNRLRYRKPRFLNRVSSKNKGWLAPSIKNKIQTHICIIEKLHKILPITKIIVEVAQFDIQKIKNPDISGVEYQQGEQLDFFNVREYVLYRDDHKCQLCNGKSKDKILNVHHIESRKTGGGAPNNLITLCSDCHKKHHEGDLTLKVKRGQLFKDASFMGIMRWVFYNNLKEMYSNVILTYGYITKNTRITNKLPKEHRIDALCITGNPIVKRLKTYYCVKQVRKHNRQIHKANILKGTEKKLNQASYLVKGFRLFDKIKFEDQECFVFGRRNTGYFDLRTLDGTKIHASANVKKLKLLEVRTSLLWERRKQVIEKHGIFLPYPNEG